MAASQSSTTLYGVPQIRERHTGQSIIGRHRHDLGYLTIVVSGWYDEEGDSGRFRLEAGDVIAHRPFESHRNFIPGSGASMLSLPLPPAHWDKTYGSIAQLDLVVRTAERNAAEATEAFWSLAQFTDTRKRGDWPDELAAWLRTGTGRIGDWATTRGLARETVSRGFRKAFGVEPVRYRWEARTRAALTQIIATNDPLAEVAAAFGFADQPHLSRQVKQMTGRSPAGWRAASHRFKTQARPAP